MIDMQTIRDEEIEKLSIALESYRHAAARQRAIATFWQDSTVRDAEARCRAALKLAEETDEKAQDIEAIIRSIADWSKEEQARIKHRLP
jgi:hypothetical protein